MLKHIASFLHRPSNDVNDFAPFSSPFWTMLVIIAPFFHRLLDDVNDFAPLVLISRSLIHRPLDDVSD